MNRREALKSFGGGAAMGLTGALIVATTSCVPTDAPAVEADPLLDLIRAYEDGLVRFNAHSDEGFDEATENGRLQRETYKPHYDAILSGAPAATTDEGAVHALRCLAKEMSEGGDEDFAISIANAVVAYLAGRAAS